MNGFYRTARRSYHRRRILRAAGGYFVNIDEYQRALDVEDGRIINLRTRDGLVLTIRRNYMDAAILAEVFLDNSYVRGVRLSEQPTIVDIGGYIGDFAIYAAKRLNARKVVVCEPSPHNWVLLKQNIANNHYGDRIAMVNKAVTDGNDVLMDVDAPDRVQARVSAYSTNKKESRAIPGVSLSTLIEDHGLTEIDLVKIDCEGGEYTILSSTPSEIFRRIKNIVFEYHEIDGFEVKLEGAKIRLSNEGYSVRTKGSLVYATR